MRDLYMILGVTSDADATIVKRRYRELARELHPDLHAGDKVKERRFKEVALAYAVLGNEQKRAQYDRERSGPLGGNSIYGEVFGEGFDTLVNRVQTEGISSSNLDDLLADFFAFAKDIQTQAPERMKKAAENLSKIKEGVPAGEEPASAGSLIGIIESLFGLDPTQGGTVVKNVDRKKK